VPLALTPLDPASLPEGARKVLAGPAPLRMMAARGLAPLKPLELVAVLYSLGIGEDAALRAAAEKSAAELPEKILAGALADASLDPRILDFFAPRLAAKPALVEVLLLNRATSDQTVLDLVPKLAERELELVAVNEQRLLRCPAIIGALYMNAKTRMSTVDRCVELAVRNRVENPGIPRWDDVVAAVTGARKPKGEMAEVPDESAADAAFAAVAQVAVGPDAPQFGTAASGDDLEVVNQTEDAKVEEEKKDLPINQLSVAGKIRLATLGNAFARAILIRDPIKMVALAAINSPGTTDNEVIKYSANRALADDVIRVIANTKEWTKLYQVKVNLTNNPKCPLPVSMRLLPFLHDRDLRNVARSKNIPSALTAQARKLLASKGQG
jgi:hypothetical protein